MARKTWVTLLGWLLVLAGAAALVLPGPGLLLLLAGLVVLSQEYEWAERHVEPVKDRAIAAAKQGVATYPRIALSMLSATAVLAVGLFWWLDPEIPEIWFIGPQLPLGGWTTGSGIILSGLVAWGLLIYSIKTYRNEAVRDRKSNAST
ncbi:MAG: PGPGW domain-containing protein [Nocardioidaceae bacterium]